MINEPADEPPAGSRGEACREKPAGEGGCLLGPLKTPPFLFAVLQARKALVHVAIMDCHQWQRPQSPSFAVLQARKALVHVAIMDYHQWQQPQSPSFAVLQARKAAGRTLWDRNEEEERTRDQE